MPELHSNGSYDPYIAQLFNSLGGGAPVNPAFYGSTGANGIFGAGAIPGLAAQPQTPWAQTPWATQTSWPFQNPLASLNPGVQQGPNPVQSLLAIQAAHQIVAKQAAHAIQCAQALQTLLQQAVSQIAGAQGQFGVSPFGANPQQQTLQQLMQYLAMQQTAPFRYGLAA
jgi:hypothetical protein